MNYPVFRFGSPECVLTVFFEKTDLYSCSQNSLKYLNSMEQFYVIDSNGNRFDLSNPKFEVPLSFWDKIAGIFSIKMRPITWVVEESDKVTVNELKNLIMNDFSENISVWQATDYELIKKNVEQANTIEEIFKAFSN